MEKNGLPVLSPEREEALDMSPLLSQVLSPAQSSSVVKCTCNCTKPDEGGCRAGKKANNNSKSESSK